MTDDFAEMDIAGLNNGRLDIDGLDNGGLDSDGLDIAGLDIVGLAIDGLDNDGRMCGVCNRTEIAKCLLEKIFTPCLCLKHRPTRCLFYAVIQLVVGGSCNS